eukprot:CAMPEP_0181119804 /NCGR_PEP_ID=MMETSP1071-20121207/23795_1 /TAXON_ID=35127 /ORGANISM="Thalassiosira sp., Strain NH16" /LENGTH=380 /DNA_ID=CAMNT_0023204371 /DNA_START=277 /DNA_END=1416 /DNA_ORIENTATION=-
MPLSSELEEFGLEVEEEEEEEHHALIDPGAAEFTTPSRRTHANAHSLSLSTPSKEQRNLLQSANIRPSRFPRPGILKWAVLVMALAIAVFLHLGRESAETEYVEEAMPDVEVVCEDEDFDLCAYARTVDPGPEREGRCRKPLSHEDEDAPPKQLKDMCRKSCGLCGTTAFKAESNDGEVCEDDPEFTIMIKSERSCASFVSNMGQDPLRESHCNRPIGIPDENKFQKLVKHFCRKSCGLCGTKDTEAGVSEAVIKAEVGEVAQEIEEKELKDEIDKEMEEIELEKEVQKEMEEQEEELEGAKEEGSNTGSQSEVDQEGSNVSGQNGDAVEDTGKKIESGSTDEQSTVSVDKEDGSDGSTQDTGKQNESGDTDEQSDVSVD